MCGLKQTDGAEGEATEVTPFVGVWIETRPVPDGREPGCVTPFVGVWIETSTRSLTAMPMAVTPFVGVWIETTSNKKLRTAIKSHTLRGCVD